MKYRWITILAVVALTVVAGCISYHCFHHPVSASTGDDADALAWVEHEFKLTGEKLERVKAMHQAYQGVCGEHCRIVAEAREKLRELQAEAAPAGQIAAAVAAANAADAMCISGTREHVKQIAAVIGGAEGERYLAIVLPRVGNFDHSAPPTLDMNKINKNAEHAHHHIARQ